MLTLGHVTGSDGGMVYHSGTATRVAPGVVTTSTSVTGTHGNTVMTSGTVVTGGVVTTGGTAVVVAPKPVVVAAPVVYVPPPVVVPAPVFFFFFSWSCRR